MSCKQFVSAIVIHEQMLKGRRKRLAADEKRRKVLEWRRQRPRSNRFQRNGDTGVKKRQRSPTLGLNIWRPIQGAHFSRHYRFVVPKTFSFLDNLEESLDALADLGLRLASDFTTSVYIDHSICDQLDLCASGVLDVLLIRAHRYRKSRIQRAGQYSSNAKVNLLLRSIGLLANISHSDANLPHDVMKPFELFRLSIGHRSDPAKSTETEHVSGELVDFLNKCVLRLGYELLPDWKANLAGMISETLDNAEQHAFRDSEWYVIAYFEQRFVGDIGGDCHLVLFNFGDSIYQSLRRSTTPKPLRERIEALAKHHRNLNFFGHNRSKWTEETLWTLYALQQGVSRFKGNPGSEDRGNGTVKMIEAIGQLCAGGRKVVLVSGSTCIEFDGRFTMKDESVDGDFQKIIAFNESNSLLSPPDPKAVRGLRGFFPGVLLSVRFDLTRANLATKNEVAYEHPTTD